MLRRIPSICTKDVDSFFVSIDSRLSSYENLKCFPVLLELAIWKSKLPEQFDTFDTFLSDTGFFGSRIKWFYPLEPL
jgi:hypothetical protein